MKLILTIFTFILVNVAYSSDFNNGLNALHNKQYSKSIGYFLLATEQEPMNISAWNNLGISYYKLRKYGHAIHAFKKASKLDPSDKNPQNNIELCYEKLEPTVRIDEDYSTTQKVAYQIGGFKLNIIAFVFSILFSVFLYRLLKKNQTMRNIYLVLSIPALFFLIVSIFLSFKANTYLNSIRNAVIVQQKAPLYLNEMGKLSDETLVEGSSVAVSKEKDGFYQIKGSVGQTLYLRKTDGKVF
ncbi:MAG: tetratricopeptide repeat protein [Bacteroidota bacterium]